MESGGCGRSWASSERTTAAAAAQQVSDAHWIEEPCTSSHAYAGTAAVRHTSRDVGTGGSTRFATCGAERTVRSETLEGIGGAEAEAVGHVLRVLAGLLCLEDALADTVQVPLVGLPPEDKTVPG